MTKDAETTSEPGSVTSPAGHAPARRPYESPHLQEWGSILELTHGPKAGFKDAGFHGGSSGV
jgi:hypothetical protein